MSSSRQLPVHTKHQHDRCALSPLLLTFDLYTTPDVQRCSILWSHPSISIRQRYALDASRTRTTGIRQSVGTYVSSRHMAVSELGLEFVIIWLPSTTFQAKATDQTKCRNKRLFKANGRQRAGIRFCHHLDGSQRTKHQHDRCALSPLLLRFDLYT